MGELYFQALERGEGECQFCGERAYYIISGARSDLRVCNICLEQLKEIMDNLEKILDEQIQIE